MTAHFNIDTPNTQKYDCSLLYRFCVLGVLILKATLLGELFCGGKN
jgi:hypothetical protein